MKKFISAFVVFVALSELSGCGIKGKLYIEPEFTQQEQEDEDGPSEQTSEKVSKSETESEKNSKK